MARLLLTEHSQGLTPQTLPPPPTLGGRDEDPDFTETENLRATELVSGEAQAFENFKQQLSVLFSHLIFSRGP